ncbi:MAG: helix-hairpin-helix domain-containing protein [Deltaproteobacteria bacterium]|nr:helix-hairpin-helix domain-containing protein [Deltaproteobacteria bacterium]
MRKRLLKLSACVMVISILMLPVYLIAGEKINLNTATLEELTKLKRIGPAYAQRIIDYREKYGPFEKIQDLMKVKGIGQKTFDANKKGLVKRPLMQIKIS